MLRFYRLILALVSVLGVVLIAPQQLTGRHTLSPFALLFTNPDGSFCPGPCMFGIQPDKTTYDEAVERLRLHPLTRDLEIGRGPSFTSRGIQILLAEDDDGKVTQIHVLLRLPGDSGWSPLNEASVGDMIIAIGNPDYIRFDMILFSNQPISYWFYNDRWLIVNVEHPLFAVGANGSIDIQKLRVEDRVIGLGMGSYAKQPEFADTDSVKIAGWHGFASLNRYVACKGKSVRIDCVASN